MKHWKIRWAIKFILCCFLVLNGIVGISSNEVLAKEYFVAANNGNDGNNGAKEAPFRSLKKGVSVLSPGDTLYVRGGTYVGSSSLSSIPSGISWSNPVIIRAYPQEEVIITAEPGKTLLEFKDGSLYIIIDGFVFDAKGGHDGIRTRGAQYLRIMNSEIKNAPNQGIMVGSAHNEFINLLIHDNGSDQFSHGIYLASSFNLVKKCKIYRNAARGINVYSGTSEKPNNNLMIQNTFYANGRVKGGTGIILGYGTGNKIINNKFSGSVGNGIVADWGPSDTLIYNNTIYGYGEYGILIGSNTKNTKVINNIVYNNKNNLLLLGSGTVGSNNLTTNPIFVDEVTKDFHLKSGSPAIGAGVILPEVTNDFDDNPRPPNTNYDIGAFQKSGNFLAAPSALRVMNP